MPNLSTIYDNFTAVVAAALPATYRQMPNPYDPAAGTQLYKTKGFGVIVKPGREKNLEAGTKRGRERTLTVILVNQTTHLEHDLTGAKNADKSVIEDMMAIEKAIENNNTLTGACIKVDYTADTGVHFLPAVSPLSKLITVSIDFLVLYEDTLP